MFSSLRDKYCLSTAKTIDLQGFLPKSYKNNRTKKGERKYWRCRLGDRLFEYQLGTDGGWWAEAVGGRYWAVAGDQWRGIDCCFIGCVFNEHCVM